MSLNPPDQSIASRFAVAAISTIATIAVPTAIGYWLDQQMGSVYFILIGLCLGMTAGTFTLIRFAQRWTPVARRSEKELTDDQMRDDEQSVREREKE